MDLLALATVVFAWSRYIGVIIIQIIIFIGPDHQKLDVW